MNLRDDALEIFWAGVKAANAEQAVRRRFILEGESLVIDSLRIPVFPRIFVVAIGKAAPQMAAALESVLGPRLSGGIVVTKHGHMNHALDRLSVIEAAHPIPDEAGARAASAVAELLADLTSKDLLIVAISGGASALLCAPLNGISLAAKRQTTDTLLRAGADIFELNCVRKHISLLKGGNLAALAFPATVVSLLLSDVIGDPLDVIGSGLTAPDSSTFGQAMTILRKRKVLDRIPKAVREHLERGAHGEISETPKPGDKVFNDVHNIVIGSNRIALEAAASEAERMGYRTTILSSRIAGEARNAAQFHTAVLLEAVASGNPVRPPACILSGGETTVTVRGDGKGGRNQEFALAMASALAGTPEVLCLCAGTDGTDGPTDAAGAIVTGETFWHAEQKGLDPTDYLARNDSYRFFDALGDLVKTGPTGTNVMDINILLAG